MAYTGYLGLFQFFCPELSLYAHIPRRLSSRLFCLPELHVEENLPLKYDPTNFSICRIVFIKLFWQIRNLTSSLSSETNTKAMLLVVFSLLLDGYWLTRKTRRRPIKLRGTAARTLSQTVGSRDEPRGALVLCGRKPPAFPPTLTAWGLYRRSARTDIAPVQLGVSSWFLP